MHFEYQNGFMTTYW